MSRHLVSLLALALVGCANVPPAAREVPRAWAQSAQEAGALPVGRIVASEEQTGRAVRAPPQDLVIWGGAYGVVAPLVAGAIMDLARQENYFRYAIRLEGTGEIAVREEYVQFRLGDCVALRSQPLLLVPALPQACK